MTAEKVDASAKKAQAESEEREAAQYWGYLIKDDKCGSSMFDKLLLGIANVIVSLPC